MDWLQSGSASMSVMRSAKTGFMLTSMLMYVSVSLQASAKDLSPGVDPCKAVTNPCSFSLADSTVMVADDIVGKFPCGVPFKRCDSLVPF